MTATELISGGRFADALRALDAELAGGKDPRQALASIELARNAALAARASLVDELLRTRSRRRLLRGY